MYTMHFHSACVGEGRPHMHVDTKPDGEDLSSNMSIWQYIKWTHPACGNAANKNCHNVEHRSSREQWSERAEVVPYVYPANQHDAHHANLCNIRTDCCCGQETVIGHSYTRT